MHKLPNLSGREIIKVLTRMGFVQVRQKGSHVILKRRTLTHEIGCVVPLHKEVALGTLKGILKQGNITQEDFLSAL
jgi:predicted RNA binding protein YcfA (HicA-like mRNA interferase family)